MNSDFFQPLSLLSPTDTIHITS